MQAKIEGVFITPLEQISDERGKVMHMIREDSLVYTRFGEIYFSCVNPRSIKAWHLHKKMTLNYAVIHGEIKFVLYDDRPNSKTRGHVEEFLLSPENYCLVTVPPLIWNGFQGVDEEVSIVANCATLPYEPDEIKRKAFNDEAIPYNW